MLDGSFFWGWAATCPAAAGTYPTLNAEQKTKPPKKPTPNAGNETTVTKATPNALKTKNAAEN